MKWITHEIRRKVILNSKGKCFYCKKNAAKAAVNKRGMPILYDENGRTFHIDHKQPLFMGGKDDISNLVMACADCNLKRKKQTLLHEPEVKKFVQMVNKRAKK